MASSPGLISGGSIALVGGSRPWDVVVAPADTAGQIAQDLITVVGRIDQVAGMVSDLRGWLEGHEQRIIALQRVFEACEDRSLRTHESVSLINEVVQRADAELQRRLDDMKKHIGERGDIVEVKHHLEWTETKINHLIARVAAGEEQTEQLKLFTQGPGKKAWDVWEVTEARRDMELMREELTRLKGSGVVTKRMLAQITDPLRRELEQLSSGSPQVAGIVETLTQEVVKVRELAALCDQNARKEEEMVHKEVTYLTQSLRNGLSPLIGDSPTNMSIDVVKRDELKEAIREEFAALSGSATQGDKNLNVATDVLRKEVATKHDVREIFSQLWKERISNGPSTAQDVRIGDLEVRYEGLRKMMMDVVDVVEHAAQKKKDNVGIEMASVLSKVSVVRAIALHAVALHSAASASVVRNFNPLHSTSVRDVSRVVRDASDSVSVGG
jgi:hypothetical protein